MAFYVMHNTFICARPDYSMLKKRKFYKFKNEKFVENCSAIQEHLKNEEKENETAKSELHSNEIKDLFDDPKNKRLDSKKWKNKSEHENNDFKSMQGEVEDDKIKGDQLILSEESKTHKKVDSIKNEEDIHMEILVNEDLTNNSKSIKSKCEKEYNCLNVDLKITQNTLEEVKENKLENENHEEENDNLNYQDNENLLDHDDVEVGLVILSDTKERQNKEQGNDNLIYQENKHLVNFDHNEIEGKQSILNYDEEGQNHDKIDDIEISEAVPLDKLINSEIDIKNGPLRNNCGNRDSCSNDAFDLKISTHDEVKEKKLECETDEQENDNVNYQEMQSLEKFEHDQVDCEEFMSNGTEESLDDHKVEGIKTVIIDKLINDGKDKKNDLSQNRLENEETCLTASFKHTININKEVKGKKQERENHEQGNININHEWKLNLNDCYHDKNKGVQKMLNDTEERQSYHEFNEIQEKLQNEDMDNKNDLLHNKYENEDNLSSAAINVIQNKQEEVNDENNNIIISTKEIDLQNTQLDDHRDFSDNDIFNNDTMPDLEPIEKDQRKREAQENEDQNAQCIAARRIRKDQETFKKQTSPNNKDLIKAIKVDQEIESNTWRQKTDDKKMRTLAAGNIEIFSIDTARASNETSKDVEDGSAEDLHAKFVKDCELSIQRTLKIKNNRFLSPCDRKEKVIDREYELYKKHIIPNKTKYVKFEKEFAAKISSAESNEKENKEENASIESQKQLTDHGKKDVRFTKDLSFKGMGGKPTSSEEGQLYWIFLVVSWLPLLLLASLAFSFVQMILEMEKN